MKLSYQLVEQSWPLAKEFRISRGAKTQANVLLLALSDGEHVAWGESVPYARYGETLTSVSQQIERIMPLLSSQTRGEQLSQMMPAGAARNLVDCALWDLRAKKANASVATLLGLTPASTVITAQTLSIDTKERMAAEARTIGNAQLIKIKLDEHDIIEKMEQIHLAAPQSQFIIDANEAWSFETLIQVLPALAKLNVALIEQPLPSNNDTDLATLSSPIPICADESCHVSADLAKLKGKYQAINIKLDKAGGLTEAVKLMQAATEQGFIIMTGCMVGTSLAMAPAYLLSGASSFVDLDGPLLISKDRDNGFTFADGQMQPHSSAFWGGENNQTNVELARLFTS